YKVTGVQTCALPIFASVPLGAEAEDALQCGEPNQVYRRLGLRVKRDGPAPQSIDHLVSRHRAGARENLADRGNTAGSQVAVQSELGIPSGVRSHKDRAQQLN